MSRQKLLLGGAFLLLCCISDSQQIGLPFKNPKEILVIGLKDVTKDILKAKDTITDVVHEVSPHILGPIVDVFDPEWLKRINYTRWVNDMEQALQAGDVQVGSKIWAEMVSKTFDIPRVIEEVKTSTTTISTCLACKFGINVVRHLVLSGKSDQYILNIASYICSVLKIQSARVCSGIMQLIGIDVLEVVKGSDMTPAQICSFLFHDACVNGYDPRHDWRMTFTRPEKQATHPTTPPLESSPMLKVLQISDTHYDPSYEEGMNTDCGEPLCCRAKDGLALTRGKAAGKWGDYRKCDTPLRLFHNALKHISDTHKDIDYIIWTGDLIPHDVWLQTKEDNLNNLKVSAELMATYFKGIPIYPSVGNHESCPVDSYAPPSAPPRKNMSWLYDELDKEWSRWLPAETSETIRRGAFYSTLIKPGFRLLSVNGNYCSKNNFWLMKNSTDPVGELAWLIRELDAAEIKGEKVHIIGHIPPGGSDCLKVWSKNYYDIINRYESTIMAQFFGHTHFDEFEVFYDTKDLKRPVNIGYITPSITPWENVNPAYRIYYVDGDHSQTTRGIIDHETWKMNLDEANRNDNPHWYKAYRAKAAYNMTSLLPKDWDDLITRMKNDKYLFETFYRNYYRNSPVRPSCDDDACRRKLLCHLRSGRSADQQNLCYDL